MNSSEVVTTLIIECHVYTSLSSLVNGILDRIECFYDFTLYRNYKLELWFRSFHFYQQKLE